MMQDRESFVVLCRSSLRAEDHISDAIWRYGESGAAGAPQWRPGSSITAPQSKLPYVASDRHNRLCAA